MGASHLAGLLDTMLHPMKLSAGFSWQLDLLEARLTWEHAQMAGLLPASLHQRW